MTGIVELFRRRDRQGDQPADLSDTPKAIDADTAADADGLEATDCTGVIKGNADIVCERGEFSPDARMSLPAYPSPTAGYGDHEGW